MYIEKKVKVEEILYEDGEIQLLKTTASAQKALLYLAITSRAKKNDEIIVNATSTELKLGTGGMDIVISVLGSLPKQELSPNGHIIKARYLPQQHSVQAVESQESQYHQLFKQTSFSLNEKKILIGELHSMIPICFWGMDFLKKEGKMVVIISDEASIPLSLSDHVRALKRDQRFITITIGQAFGGTYEAINLPTALQFATKILNGDVILITLGPGVVGTHTRFGFSGIEQASWANMVGSLGGIPVWIPRLSEADSRERHRGISHHTLTPLKTFTYPKCVVPLPVISGPLESKINMQAEELNLQHHINWVDKEPLEVLVEHCLRNNPLPIKTMGREYQDDRLFFLGVAAALKWVLEH
ncbi:DUF3866 family protein [Bacillaceae bacterium IKA-2]|nr:DUF3866 family protein [Bacillaceae bacterium IKA-2]